MKPLQPETKPSRPGVKASRLQHFKPSLVGRVGRGFGWGFGWGFLFLLLCACSRPPLAQLSEADALMEANPDSALALLQAVDTAALAPDDRPYFALLLTQAQVKTGAPIASDSLISAALNAYRFSPNPDLRKRAHFYAAQLAHWQGKERSAMKNVIEAYDISKDLNDDYWIAKSAELISDILFKIYDYPESFQFEKEAVEFYQRAGKTANHRYAICDLSQHYLMFGEPGRAYALADSIATIAAGENPPDEALENYALRIVILALIDMKEYDRAKGLFARFYGRDWPEEVKLDMFLAENAVNNVDNRTAYVSKLFEAYSLANGHMDQVRIKYADYNNALLSNDFKTAALMADSLIQMQSEIAWDMLCESVLSVQRDFYVNKSLNEKKQSEFYSVLAIIIVVLSAIVILVVLVVYHYRMQAKRTELAVAASSLLSVQKNYREVTRELFRDQWATLNMLCNSFFNLSSDGIKKETLLKSIEDEINKLKKPKNISQIEESVNRYHDNIIETLRQECGFLNKSDVVFITLIIAGFSPRAVCLFTDIKYKQYYQKKSRLCQRILKANPPHCSEFLQYLS